MPTVNLNITPKLPRKTTDIDETDSQHHNGTHLEGFAGTGAEYFEIVTRATDGAVRDWNVSTGALAWPRGLQSLLGYERSAASEKIGFWFSHIHPEDLARIQDSLRDAFTGPDDRWTGEYRFRHSDGDYIHILERALIFRDGARRGGARGGSDDGRNQAEAIAGAGLPHPTNGSLRATRRRGRA